MNEINILKYTDAIRRHYGERLTGYQLIHESEEVHLYVVYSDNGKFDVVRVFPNYFTKILDVSVEHRLDGLSEVSLTDLMQLVETLVNTLKGEV